MKVLKINEEYLMLCGILSKAEDTKQSDKMLKFLRNLIFSFGLLHSLVLCSVLYIYHNPVDVSGVTNALVHFVCGSTSLVAYIGLIANERNIKLLHEELQDIVDGDCE